MTEILNVKNCGLQFAVGYVKKKDSWSLGWTSNPYYRILVSYMCIRQYRNISYDIGKITI